MNHQIDINCEQNIQDNTTRYARVTAVHRERYALSLDGNTIYGKLKTAAWRESGALYPTVGDWVEITPNPQGDALITALKPRRTLFRRSDGFGKRGVQVVAANFESVFIVTSLNRDFELRRIERYLALTLESGAQPVIVLTKADLCPDPAPYIEAVRALKADLPVYAVSAATGQGLDTLMPYLQPGMTAALLGSSGVGKSTLTNALMGEAAMDTGAIREDDDRGRHTTTYRQLLELPGGAYLIDTPGMRELGVWDADEGVRETFGDLVALAGQCRFRDCSHTCEPGCAVRAAIERGEIDEKRVRNWLNVGHESHVTAELARRRAKLALRKQSKAQHSSGHKG